MIEMLMSTGFWVGASVGLGSFVVGVWVGGRGI